MVWTSSKWGQFWVEVKFDLEGQGQLPPKTIGILTKVFCFSGPNMVILAWTGEELSCGHASDWYTHTQTQATTIPVGQNWPQVIKTTIFTHRPRVSLACFSFCWWRHNRLLMTSQWPDNCDVITWIVKSNSLDIDFIHGNINGQSCEKIHFQVSERWLNLTAFLGTADSEVHTSRVITGYTLESLSSLT